MIKPLNHIAQTSFSFIKVLFLSRWIGVLTYKTTKKSCVIIGNGPSFMESVQRHKALLLKNDLICVNSFANTSFYRELQPRFYVLQAPILFEPNTKSSTFYITYRDELYKNIREQTDWELLLVVPFKAKKSTEFRSLLAQNKKLKAIYYNDTAIEGFDSFTSLCFSLKLGMPRPHNVLIPTLMTSIGMGFKEIYLIGADHSWLGEISVNEQNEALVNQKHFYDENASKPEKMQDYINRPRRLHEIIHKFYLSFRGYWEIKTFAERKNVTIVNCSETSMIDAFDRQSLDKIIN
jgi:hypothetical protein